MKKGKIRKDEISVCGKERSTVCCKTWYVVVEKKREAKYHTAGHDWRTRSIGRPHTFTLVSTLTLSSLNSTTNRLAVPLYGREFSTTKGRARASRYCLFTQRQRQRQKEFVPWSSLAQCTYNYISCLTTTM